MPTLMVFWVLIRAILADWTCRLVGNSLAAVSRPPVDGF
jgi:hypothetical protein